MYLAYLQEIYSQKMQEKEEVISITTHKTLINRITKTRDEGVEAKKEGSKNTPKHLKNMAKSISKLEVKSGSRTHITLQTTLYQHPFPVKNQEEGDGFQNILNQENDQKTLEFYKNEDDKDNDYNIAKKDEDDYGQGITEAKHSKDKGPVKNGVEIDVTYEEVKEFDEECERNTIPKDWVIDSYDFQPPTKLTNANTYDTPCQDV